MAVTVHISRIVDSWANVLADLDAGQTALLTDQNNEHIHRIGDDFVFPAVSKVWDSIGSSWSYNDVEFNDIDAFGDIAVGQDIFLYGETDTRIRFGSSTIGITAGGVDFVNITEDGTQDIIELNADNLDVDTIINASGLEAFNLNGASGKLTLGADLNVKSTTPRINLKDSDCADDVNGVWLYANATDTGSGTEDVDFYVRQLVNGANVTFFESIAAGAITIGDGSRDVVLDGNVGIGTTGPLAKHDVNGSRVIRYGGYDYFTKNGATALAEDGNWRTYVENTTNDLVTETRISGTWTEIERKSAT